MLCIGVIICASTWQVKADNVEVTAKVSAPLPDAPAVITSPVDQQHVSAALIDVFGNCPNGSYVKLSRNDIFSGVAQCESGHFTIQTSLSFGANRLQPQVFNTTDDEGPASASSIVYYDKVTTGQNIFNDSSAASTSGGNQIQPPSQASPSGQPLIITGDYRYVIHYAGDAFTWDVRVSGGAAPYRIHVDWGDGQTATFETNNGALNLNHIFVKGGNFQPLVQVTDTAGAVTSLQLSAVVKERPVAVAAILPFTDDIQRYLGILWPAYLAVTLMLVSFWLGEMEFVHIWKRKLRGKSLWHRQS